MLGVSLIAELPFSDMSMNAARSLAGSIATEDFRHLWIISSLQPRQCCWRQHFLRLLQRPADLPPVPYFHSHLKIIYYK
jgi:hypothetical protein